MEAANVAVPEPEPAPTTKAPMSASSAAFCTSCPNVTRLSGHGEVELSKDFHDSCLARIANHVVRPHLYHLLLFKDFLKPCPGGWLVGCHNRHQALPGWLARGLSQSSPVIAEESEAHLKQEF
ncbi:hypothetical protein MTO96_047078 [Rhipicephalus appendiculatus]